MDEEVQLSVLRKLMKGKRDQIRVEQIGTSTRYQLIVNQSIALTKNQKDALLRMWGHKTNG